LIDANEIGSGKTLLCDVISAIVRGRKFSRRTVPEESAEWKKALLGIAIAADPVVLNDNVKRMITSDAFEAVLTGEGFKERILGRNEEMELPIRTVFFVTANNATMSADLVRRSLHVRIEAGENPASRTGFKYPDLVAHAEQNRARYLSALVTILRAYVVAGRPPVKLRPMGSFEAWSAVVRAALVWAGECDPAETQDALRESGAPEVEELLAVLRAWRDLYGDRAVAVAVVLSDLGQPGLGPRERALADALATWVDGDPARLGSASRKIANRLRVSRGRILDGLTVQKGGDDSNLGQRWRVRATRGRAAESADSADSVSATPREEERERDLVDLDSADSAESFGAWVERELG